MIMMLPSSCPSGGADGLLRIGSSLEVCGTCPDVAKCRSLGITSYLPKPVRSAELLDAMFNATASLAKSDVQLQSSADVPQEIRRLSILLTEDNIINQKIARRVLEEWGHMIEVASNGKEALAKLEEQKFDLVLMDIQMPEMDGLEATRAIRDREMESGEHIPIIAITAHAMKGDRKRCLDAGMDGYISKPINTKALFDRINAVAVVPKANGAAATNKAAAPKKEESPVLASTSSSNGNGHHRVATGSNGNGNGNGNGHRDGALIPLKNADGTPLKFSDELLSAFAEDTPRKLRELRDAVASGEKLRLKELSHYLKGSAMYIGARRMSELCRDLEFVAFAAEEAKLSETMQSLEQEAERVYAELTELRQKNGRLQVL
jgi:two-component system, sensor histidine kinase and response regulator